MAKKKTMPKAAFAAIKKTLDEEGPMLRAMLDAGLPTTYTIEFQMPEHVKNNTCEAREGINSIQELRKIGKDLVKRGAVWVRVLKIIETSYSIEDFKNK